MSYDIDYSKLNKLQQFIENQEEFKLTGIPSEPITHNHRFISDKHIKSYKDDNLTFIFLNDAVSIMLLAIKNKELILPLNQKVKFLALTYRILNLIKWNSKFSYYKSLLLLNMFEIFGAELLLRENNSEDINEIKDSAIFKQYKAYKIMLAEGEIKSVPIGAHLINSIIYSTQMGFCKLKVVRKDKKIDLDSPLGENVNFGSKLCW